MDGTDGLYIMDMDGTDGLYIMDGTDGHLTPYKRYTGIHAHQRQQGQAIPTLKNMQVDL
jgi:hypothetical protein